MAVKKEIQKRYSHHAAQRSCKHVTVIIAWIFVYFSVHPSIHPISISDHVSNFWTINNRCVCSKYFMVGWLKTHACQRYGGGGVVKGERQREWNIIGRIVTFHSTFIRTLQPQCYSLRMLTSSSLSLPSPGAAGLPGFDRRTGRISGSTLFSVPASTPSSKRATRDRVWPWGHVWCWGPSCSRGRGRC